MRVANTKEIKPRAYSAHMHYVLYIYTLRAIQTLL